MDKLGFVRYLALVPLLLLKKHTLCYDIKVASWWPAEPKHLLNSAVFPWLASLGIQGFFSAPFDHKESSVQFTNCLSFGTVDALAAGKYNSLCHHRGQPPRQRQLTMCPQDNATQHSQSGPGRRGGVGWLVFVRRKRLMLQLCSTMMRGGDGTRQSVCFHQRVWTGAVFLAASALQGNRHRSFAQFDLLYLPIYAVKLLAMVGEGPGVTEMKLKCS